MLRYLLISVFSILAFTSCDLFENEQGEYPGCWTVFTVAEQMPVLKGNFSDFRSHIEYPSEALKDSVEGRVIVQFVVNKEGVPLNPKVIQSLTSETDAEAVRVVREYSRFNRGAQNGEPVCVQYSLPIVFRLED